MRAVRARRSLTLTWSSLCIVVVPAFWDKFEERERVGLCAKPDLLAIWGHALSFWPAYKRIAALNIYGVVNQVVK